MVRRRRSSTKEGVDGKMTEEVDQSGITDTADSSASRKDAPTHNTKKSAIAPSESKNALSWSHVLSGKAGSLPVVFTKDGQYFFVAVASTVRIYSTQHGNLVSTLSAQTHASASASKLPRSNAAAAAHTATITGLLLNPNNPAQLITSSLDGTVKVWDYLDAHMLRSLSLDFPITHMCAHPSLSDEVIVALRKPRGKETDARSDGKRSSTNVIIQRISLQATKKQNGRVRLGKVRSVTDMSVSADGRFIVIVGGRKMYVVQLHNKDAGLARFLTDKSLTRVAFHPLDNAFATGHENGQIRLWYFLNDERYTKQISTSSQSMQLAPNTVLHWHAHSVSALRFNGSGSMLLSGGEESTLVLWQMTTQSREYVPRLGGSRILSISVLSGIQGQQDQIVTALQDGSVAFIGVVNLKMTRTLSGVLANSSLQTTLAASVNASVDPCIPFAMEPETGNLVTMSGHPSTLQFIAASNDDAQVMQIEVVPSNRVSRPDELPLEQARVEHVCFSSQREWMATIDRKASGEFSLKIWQWDKKGETYTVNTRIEEPHGQGARVTAVSFSPRPYVSLSDAPLLISAGTDNKCRVWRCVGREEKRQRIRYWVARSTFDRRGLSIRAFALSLDGSLVAVAHESCVSLWDPESNSEVHCVPLPFGPSISASSLVFLPKQGGRYFALSDDLSTCVIDAVHGIVKSAERISDAVSILALPTSERTSADFAIIATSDNGTQSNVFLRSIDSSTDKHSEKSFALPFAINRVLPASAEVANGVAEMRFFAMTAHYDVVFVSEETTSKRSGTEADRLQSTGRQRLRTIYDELLGPARMEASTERPLRRQVGRTEQKCDLGSLFAVASHLLPPAHLLFETFMQTSLPSKSLLGKEELKSSTKEIEHTAAFQQADQDETRILNSPSEGKKLSDVAAMELSDVVDLFADLAVARSLSNGDVITNGSTTNPAHGEHVQITTPKASKQNKKSRASKDVEGSTTYDQVPISTEKVGRKRKNSNAA